jgi:hypothetical protein
LGNLGPFGGHFAAIQGPNMALGACYWVHYFEAYKTPRPILKVIEKGKKSGKKFPGTGKPFQIFRAQKPTNEWEKLFPNFIVKDSDTRSIISDYDVIKSTMSKIVGSLIPGILKNIKNLIEKGVTMKGVSPDLQKQTVNLIIYSADHEKNKEAADLLKLFLGNQTFKEALEPSCLTKLIARESAYYRTRFIIC